MGRAVGLIVVFGVLAPLRNLQAQEQPPPAPAPAPPPETPTETAPPDPQPLPADPTPEPDPLPPAEAPPPAAAPAPVEEAIPPPAVDVPGVQLHGFVSQGAFISTDNNWLGPSEKGSVEFTEAALNASSEVADRLRVGLQLFTRDVGPIGDYKITLDWAFLDYRWKEWIGMRAGRVKMPFGLYNEVNDVPGGRLPILLPQSIYPVSSRDFLLALTGGAVYGSPLLGKAGALDYQVFFGTIFLDLSETPQFLGARTRRAGGAQVFWRTPIEGLRIGPSFLNVRVDFDFQLDPMTVDQLIMAGTVPADFDGRAQLRIRDANLLIGSVEYEAVRWTFAAEYSRQLVHVDTTPDGLVPESDEDSDSERFYLFAARRLTEDAAVGGYASFQFNDVDNRSGDGLPVPHTAYQQDYAATGRYNINEFWLIKLEAHLMRGSAVLSPADNPGGNLEKTWGLFLAQTVLSF